MQEDNKNIVTINFSVLTLSLWGFAGFFTLTSYFFTVLVNFFKINNFVKSLNEYLSALILTVLVFVTFSGCLLFTEKFLKQFWPKFLNNNKLHVLIITGLLLLVSLIGVYYVLAWVLMFVENKI